MGLNVLLWNFLAAKGANVEWWPWPVDEHDLARAIRFLDTELKVLAAAVP